MISSKRAPIVLALLIMLAAPGTPANEPEPVPATNDLEVLAERARAQDLPILIAFAERGCSSCKALEKEELAPRQAAEGEPDALIGKIMVGNRARLIDFDGTLTEPSTVAARYDAWGTPTVVLVDATGEALAEPLVGYIMRPMYGAYLDRAIAQARRRLDDR